MVPQPRYIVDQFDSHGDVIRSDPFKTQREVVEAFPNAFTAATIREAFRTVKRVRFGDDAVLQKYQTFKIRRYPK